LNGYHRHGRSSQLVLPLHSTLAGRRFGRVAEPLAVTDDVAERLIRVPLWTGMGKRCHAVIDAVKMVLNGRVKS